MITKEQEFFIKQFIPEEKFNTEKVISYLKLHDKVGLDIFNLAKKSAQRNWLLLEEDFGYFPIETNLFIKRIPFYFYLSDIQNKHYGDLTNIILVIRNMKNYNDVLLESLYRSLEKMFYVRKMNICDIMDYSHLLNVADNNGELFLKWIHYLDLCDILHIDNKYPENILYEINRAMELLGEIPKIYEHCDLDFFNIFVRNNNEILIGGDFPYDSCGNPALQWIGVWIENAAYVKIDNSYLSNKTFTRKTLRIGLTHTTKIYFPNQDNYQNDEIRWEPIYLGPLVTNLDNTVFKKLRTKQNLTQQQVADSIGVQLRTYQKWEQGQTKPDGYSLVRLMNVFNIDTIQDIIENTPIIDNVHYDKFRSRKQYS